MTPLEFNKDGFLSALPSLRKSQKQVKMKPHLELNPPDEAGKNEGIDTSRAYDPPPGYTLVKKSEDAGEFDWDAITKNENREIWLIRVPDGIKPKQLENFTIEVPPAAVTARVGRMERKFATFDVWSIGDVGSEQNVCGEEIRSLTCLLPRHKSKKGKLYTVPIARRLVFSAQAVEPSTDPSSSSTVIGPFQRPPREAYPPEVLKHTFMPYGSLSSDGEAPVDAMVVDGPAVPIPSEKKPESGQANPDEAVSRSPAVTEKKVKRQKDRGKGGVVAAKVEVQKVVEKDKTEGTGKTRGMKRKGVEQTPTLHEKKPKKPKTS